MAAAPERLQLPMELDAMGLWIESLARLIQNSSAIQQEWTIRWMSRFQAENLSCRRCPPNRVEAGDSTAPLD